MKNAGSRIRAWVGSVLMIVGTASVVQGDQLRPQINWRYPLATETAVSLPDLWGGLSLSSSFAKTTSLLYKGDQYQQLRTILNASATLRHGLSLRASLAFRRASDSQVIPDSFSSRGDASLGALWSYLTIDAFRFASFANLFAYSGASASASVFDSLTPQLGHAISWQNRRWQIDQDISLTIDRSAAVLGRSPTQMESTAYQLSNSNQLKFGLAGSYLGHLSQPFVEVDSRLWLSGHAVQDFTFSAGNVLPIGRWLAFNFVASATLRNNSSNSIPAAMPWQIQFGLSSTFDIPDTLYRIKQLIDLDPVWVILEARDIGSKQLVADAEINWYSAAQTGSGKGSLRWAGYAREGTFEVLSADYLPVTNSVTLLGGKTFRKTVYLTPVKGWLAGQLYNHASSAPAHLLTEQGVELVAGGNPFHLSLSPGTYHLQATATGAAPIDLAFDIRAGTLQQLGNIHLFAPGQSESTLARRPGRGETEQAPDTQILYTSEGWNHEGKGVVVFTSYAWNVSAYTCRLDDEPWQPCSSPWQLQNLPDGRHAVAVSATSHSGLHELEPALAYIKVDQRAPQTRFDRVPAQFQRDTIWPIWFEVSDDTVALFECAFDQDAFVRCASPWTVSSTEQGEHVFRVRATDYAGNIEDPPATISWILVEGFKPTPDNELYENDTDEIFSDEILDAQAYEEALNLDKIPITPESLEQGVIAGTFATGSWKLSPEALQRLAKVAQILSSRRDLKALIIEGSVDSSGPYASNLVIARRRALSAYMYLRDAGLNPSLMGIKVAVFVRSPGSLSGDELARERGVNLHAVYGSKE